MSLITWDQDKFSVGIDEINEQHKKWITLINRLHDSIMTHDSEISQEIAIREMLDYTHFHFKQEEDLLRKVAYPDYEKHKLEHGHFILKLEKLDQDIANGNYVLRTQIMSILKNWLENHICKVDTLYGSFISDNNRQQYADDISH